MACRANILLEMAEEREGNESNGDSSRDDSWEKLNWEGEERHRWGHEDEPSTQMLTSTRSRAEMQE